MIDNFKCFVKGFGTWNLFSSNDWHINIQFLSRCLSLSDLLMKILMLFDCDDVSICIGQSECKLMLGSKFYI
jgi:hypothetical protein